METPQNSDHFKDIFKLIVGMIIWTGLFIPAVVFLPIEKEHLRIVDLVLPFVFGTVVGASLSFLMGGSPTTKKTPPDGTITGQIEGTINPIRDENSTGNINSNPTE